MPGSSEFDFNSTSLESPLPGFPSSPGVLARDLESSQGCCESISDLLSSAAPEAAAAGETIESGSDVSEPFDLFINLSSSADFKRPRRDSDAPDEDPLPFYKNHGSDTTFMRDLSIFDEHHNPGAQEVETGFVTGNNKKILVERSKLDAGLVFSGGEIAGAQNGVLDSEDRRLCAADVDEQCPNSLLDTGFCTGRNRPIFIDELKVAQAFQDDLALHPEISICAETDRGRDAGCALNKDIFEPAVNNDPRCGRTGEERAPLMMEDDVEMRELFRRMCLYFKGEERGWVAEQFKWTWLHLCLNPVEDSNTLEEEIVEIMNLRRENEHSVLRRIVEFDDVPCRYMVLGVLEVGEGSIEVYDGYYSVRAEIDRGTYGMLRAGRCTLGSKIHVFGAELLLKAATSIFEVEGPVLRLHSNGTRTSYEQCRLGYRKKIAFLNRIAELRMDGGVVSALFARVKRVFEVSFLVTAENYRSTGADLESELEKIHGLVVRAGRDPGHIGLRTRRFARLLIEDDSGECLLTWWDAPEDVREGDRYKFVHLSPAPKASSLHLTTSKKTYAERLK